MDDALRVRFVQRAEHLLHDPDRQQRVEAPLAVETLGERLPLEHLHGQKERAVGGLTEVEDPHGVAVLQQAHGLRLAVEASDRVRIPARLLLEELQRHRPVQPDLPRTVDAAHAAGADQ